MYHLIINNLPVVCFDIAQKRGSYRSDLVASAVDIDGVSNIMKTISSLIRIAKMSGYDYRLIKDSGSVDLLKYPHKDIDFHRILNLRLSKSLREVL